MTQMKARGRMVVGVDGSAAAAAAVRWAVREARLRRTAVHLVCACDSDARLRAPYASWSWVTLFSTGTPLILCRATAVA